MPIRREFIWLGTRQQLAKINASPLQLKDQTLTPFDKVRDLGITLDSTLTMEAHVDNVVRRCVYHLRQLRSIGVPQPTTLGGHSLLRL